MKNRVNSINKEKKSKGRTMSVQKSVANVLGGSILNKQQVFRQLPFLVFLTFIALIYIANIYGAERTIMKIDRLKSEIEVLRFEQISVKSKLMDISRQTKVLKRLEGTGVKESLIPPQKIIIERQN